MNIADVIDRYAATRAMAPALIEGARTVTWAEYADLVRRTAAHLRAQGVRPGDTVGLNLKDNLGHVIAMTAVARLGARFLPLDWRARPAERQRLIEGFAASLVLTEADAPAPAGVATLPLDDRWRAAVAQAPLDQDFPHDGDAAMFIAVSSGTTGRPKGAIASHTLFRQRLAKYSVSFGLCRGHRYLSVTPLCHAAGWHYLFYALVGGSPVILHPTLFSAEEYVAAAARHEASFALLVPTVLRWLLQLPGGKAPLLPTLRILVASADVMHADEKREALARICPHFYESYSSSATGTLSVLPPEEVAARAESVGFPNLLTELQIVDEADRPLPAGAVGRIRVRGPGISSGYCGAGAEVETARDFRDGWYYTGELAERDPAGFLYLKGRASNIILRAGFTLYPEEIERVLETHPAVAEAAVVGRPHPELGEEVVAVIVARSPLEPAALLAFCRSRLQAAKVPAQIVGTDALPRSPAGKLRRTEVAELAALLLARGA